MSALSAFARADVAGVRREGLLAIVLGAPLALALALRYAYPQVESWAASTHGLDLEPHRTFVLAAAVVLHLPMMCGMVGTLLVLDDADGGVLRALRVTPVTLERYLGYRLASVGVTGLAGLCVAVPVSGLVDARLLGWLVPAVVLAAGCGPVVTLTALAVATNKVEGLTVLKAVGIPYMVPVATWFAGGAWTVLLGPLPTTWAVRSVWAGAEGRVDARAMVVGAVLITAVTALLWRRVRRRLSGLA